MPPRPLDPLLSYLARPVTTFAIGRREKGPETAELPAGFRVIAHRAGPGPAPENSLHAVLRAVAMGVRDIEVDIRQTRDARWVCSHDPDLNRVARVNRRVADLSAEELARHRAGGEPVALLEDLLQAVPEGVRLHLDLKGFTQPLAEAAASLLETIDEFGAASHVTVTSLLHPALERLRALDAELSLGYITLWLKLDAAMARCLGRHRPSHEPRRAIENAARLDADAIEPVAWQPGLGAFAEAAHAAGVSVYVYTIDSAVAATRAAAAGADGIFTNLPERFLPCAAT
jgi:glycerophosphoryl diester phosphodiesterase